MAVPAARRASDEEPGARARAVRSSAVSAFAAEVAAARIGWLVTDAARALGCASFVCPKVTSSGIVPSDSGDDSASTSSE